MSADGLHAKFHVERADGRDKAGARYFVLDYANDEHARAAVAAYANACEAELPGLAADLRRELAAAVAPPSEPALKVPCPEGFHWIGQSFARCDHCALPAWEHAGMAELPKGAGPFALGGWVLRPWKPGEADAIRRKWEPDMTLAEVIAAGQRREAVAR